ncbi:MAG: hypothetical protein JXR26_01840 [Balneolaceae bacterium]|nr:hypothetical protein [Balneolaceae bacterium]
MPQSELNTRNYKRIFWINCLLTGPLLVFFAWPYIIFAHLATMSSLIYYPGAFLFSIPFMLTLLHGHVTMALGSAHRHHYYNWLNEHALTYGLLFHPMFTSTRFRLVILSLSVIVFIAGWLIEI